MSGVFVQRVGVHLGPLDICEVAEGVSRLPVLRALRAAAQLVENFPTEGRRRRCLGRLCQQDNVNPG